MGSLEFKQKAILELRPQGGFSLNGKGEVVFITEGLNEPTESEITTVMDRLKSEWTAQEYARNRAAAYDSVGNQLDMLMKDKRDGTTTHQAACEAVKAQFPKPE